MNRIDFHMVNKVVTWKKAFIFLMLSQTVYFLMLFVTIPRVETYVNNMKIFDLMPMGYSVSYGLTLLEELGESGRLYYLTYQLPLDLVYPALMGITGVLFLTILTRELNRRYYSLTFLPILAALFDYIENGFISVILIFYPKINEVTIKCASIATILKCILTSLYLVVLLIMFVILYIKKKSNKNLST